MARNEPYQWILLYFLIFFDAFGEKISGMLFGEGELRYFKIKIEESFFAHMFEILGSYIVQNFMGIDKEMNELQDLKLCPKT